MVVHIRSELYISYIYIQATDSLQEAVSFVHSSQQLYLSIFTLTFLTFSANGL